MDFTMRSRRSLWCRSSMDKRHSARQYPLIPFPPTPPLHAPESAHLLHQERGAEGKEDSPRHHRQHLLDVFHFNLRRQGSCQNLLREPDLVLVFPKGAFHEREEDISLLHPKFQHRHSQPADPGIE
jgi:hypothetical protein